MVERIADDVMTTELSREAVRIGRKAIGPGLRQELDSVIAEPVPGYWLALLQAADHRTSARDDVREKRCA